MGLDDLFQGAGDGNGISSGEGSSFADGFTPGGGFASNDGIAPGLSDAAWGISSGGASGVSGDFLHRDPAGGYSPPDVISLYPNAQTLEVRNPADGYSPPGIISQHPSAQTLEVRAPGFANMGGASGKGLFPSFTGMGGGSGLGGSLLTPAQPGRPSFGPLADQPPFGSLADKPSFGSLTDQPSMSSLASLAGGGIRSPWNSGGGSGTAAIGKPAWGHDGRLPDDVRYSTSAIGDPMGLFGQPKNAPTIGNSEPGQGGIAYETDPFGPSANKFVNSYEAAEEKKFSEPQPSLIERALFSPGTADASSFGASQKPFTPTSGDKMIASYEAAQGVLAQDGASQEDGGLLLNVKGSRKKLGQQPQAKPVDPAEIRSDLGDSVKQFESGKRGVHEVSTGANDPGGVSYGTYQLSSNAGTLQAFLKSPEGQKYAAKFQGLTPGSAEFNARWKEVAASDPDGLHQAEKGFIYRTHYLPVAKRAAELGFDMNNPAVQDAVWSGSIQHRKFRKVLEAAAGDKLLKYRSADDQLKALYETRSKYTDSLAGVPKSAGRLRYERELPATLGRNDAYQEAKRR